MQRRVLKDGQTAGVHGSVLVKPHVVLTVFAKPGVTEPSSDRLSQNTVKNDHGRTLRQLCRAAASGVGRRG